MSSERLSKNIGICLDYLQSLFKKDIDYFSENINYEECVKYIQIGSINMELYYKFEKMFKYFIKLVKYYHRFTRMYQNFGKNYSIYIYLYYVIEYILLSKIINIPKEDNIQMRLISKIENITYELDEIYKFNSNLKENVLIFYNNINFKSYLTESIKKSYSNHENFINPIEKIFRNCNLVSDENCNEECEPKTTSSYFFMKNTSCVDKNDGMISIMVKSINNLTREELILFLCSYEQYSNEDLFFEIDYNYDRNQLISLARRLISEGLNQKYTIQNQQDLLLKSKFTKSEIIKIYDIIYDYIKYSNKSYFDLYKYIELIINNKHIFYIILYVIEYYSLENINIRNLLNLDKIELSTYSFKIDSSSKKNEELVKNLSKHKLIDFLNFPDIYIALLSYFEHSVTEFTYYNLIDIKDKDYSKKCVEMYKTPFYFSDVKLSKNYKSMEYEYQKIKIKDIYYFLNSPTMECRLNYDNFKMDKNKILEVYSDGSIEFSIKEIPIVIEIDGKMVIIDNQLSLFTFMFCGRDYVVVKFIKNYMELNKSDNNDNMEYGLNSKHVKSGYINPTLNCVKVLIEMNKI
jgi:hypothetical protein